MWPRMGASYPDPEQIPEMYLVGEETGFSACSFLFHWAEHLLPYMRDVLRKLCEDCLISHLSQGRWTTDSFPGKRRTGKHRQGPQQPLQCQGTRVPVTFPSSDVPTPALEEKPITVRCCSGADLVRKEHGILPLPGWPGFPRLLRYVPVSSCSHFVLFSRGMREIVCTPMLVAVVTEVMVRLPLFSWVLEKLMSQ